MIITLCGSARFESQFHLWNEILSLSEHVVFGLSTYPSFKDGNKDWYSEEEKRILDLVHFKKIDESDAIFVLNQFAYIGASTMREINYARSKGKHCYALESWGKGNGISEAHTEEYRRKAKKMECYLVGSPIDTFHPHFKEPWDLLPEAGAYRSGLVERINKFKKEYLKGKR